MSRTPGIAAPIRDQQRNRSLAFLTLKVNTGASLREIVQMRSFLSTLIINTDDHRSVVRHGDATLLGPICRFELHSGRDLADPMLRPTADQRFGDGCGNHDSFAALLIDNVQFSKTQLLWIRGLRLHYPEALAPEEQHDHNGQQYPNNLMEPK